MMVLPKQQYLLLLAFLPASIALRGALQRGYPNDHRFLHEKTADRPFRHLSMNMGFTAMEESESTKTSGGGGMSGGMSVGTTGGAAKNTGGMSGGMGGGASGSTGGGMNGGMSGGMGGGMSGGTKGKNSRAPKSGSGSSSEEEQGTDGGGATENAVDNGQEGEGETTAGIEIRRPPTFSFTFEVTSTSTPEQGDYDELVAVTSFFVDSILGDFFSDLEEVDYAYTLVGDYEPIEPAVVEFDFDCYFHLPAAVPSSEQLGAWLMQRLAAGSVDWAAYVLELRAMDSEYFRSTTGVALTEEATTRNENTEPEDQSKADTQDRPQAASRSAETETTVGTATIVAPIVAAVACILIYGVTLVSRRRTGIERSFKPSKNDCPTLGQSAMSCNHSSFSFGSDDRYDVTCSAACKEGEDDFQDDYSDMVEVPIGHDANFEKRGDAISLSGIDTYPSPFQVDQILRGLDDFSAGENNAIVPIEEVPYEWQIRTIRHVDPEEDTGKGKQIVCYEEPTQKAYESTQPTVELPSSLTTTEVTNDPGSQARIMQRQHACDGRSSISDHRSEVDAMHGDHEQSREDRSILMPSAEPKKTEDEDDQVSKYDCGDDELSNGSSAGWSDISEESFNELPAAS